ncbi:hypothetical protein JXQ70_07155 [bacterium]|nr:hypothetical protein [bacterium]
MNDFVRVLTVVLCALMLIFVVFACNQADNDDDNDDNNDDNDTIPQFVQVDYIDSALIYRLSKFRSGIGHDYSDDFESCRSMKHYFQPRNGVDWSTVRIYSPVTGTVVTITDEYAGSQVRIRSADYPNIFCIIFHINLTIALEAGASVTAGQQLGTHIGSQTMSDIAFGVSTDTGWKLVSYFEVMTDTLLQTYRARGLNSRNETIISQEARDADPLSCIGEEFTNSGNLENWVSLN